ncbi:MAG: hypothetical protein ACTSX7_04945 [Alphaproteobacteria bacterium]
MYAEDIAHSNRAYQGGLAQSLLANMDHDEAIDFCVSNEWGGVLEALMGRRQLDLD